jgi:hypothetical protein
MGSDIYGYLERKENEKWIVVSEVPCCRSYNMFAVLTGLFHDCYEAVGMVNYGQTYSVTSLYDKSELREREKLWVDFVFILTPADYIEYDLEKEYLDVRENEYRKVKDVILEEWKVLFEKMMSLVGDIGIKNVRIVFGFTY